MCETIRIDRAHLSRPEEGVCQFFFHDFVVDNVQKQPGGHIAIIGLFKDQRTSGVHLRPPALHGRHAREDGFCDGFFQLRKGDAVELIERRREEAGETPPAICGRSRWVPDGAPAGGVSCRFTWGGAVGRDDGGSGFAVFIKRASLFWISPRGKARAVQWDGTLGQKPACQGERFRALFGRGTVGEEKTAVASNKAPLPEKSLARGKGRCVDMPGPCSWLPKAYRISFRHRAQ